MIVLFIGVCGRIPLDFFVILGVFSNVSVVFLIVLKEKILGPFDFTSDHFNKKDGQKFSNTVIS